jgi:organic hydroperoxide reductase OsmC/OhrA
MHNLRGNGTATAVVRCSSFSLSSHLPPHRHAKACTTHQATEQQPQSFVVQASACHRTSLRSVMLKHAQRTSQRNSNRSRSLFKLQLVIAPPSATTCKKMQNVRASGTAASVVRCSSFSLSSHLPPHRHVKACTTYQATEQQPQSFVVQASACHRTSLRSVMLKHAQRTRQRNSSRSRSLFKLQLVIARPCALTC